MRKENDFYKRASHRTLMALRAPRASSRGFRRTGRFNGKHGEYGGFNSEKKK